MLDSKYLWIQVCEQLKWHNKGADSCIETLNRLWAKHLEVRAPSGEVLLEVPVLKEEMLTVYAEQWLLYELKLLSRGHSRENPLFFAPIIILSWFERHFLIDGNTRVNYWIKLKNVGPHAVLRITLNDI